MDNEFLLQDRLQKIRQIVNQYGEDNFYISFSGGRDSCVLSKLVDIALPENKIPRVYVNTGIEYNMMVKFVTEQSKIDDRIVIIQPAVPIKKMLEQDGYPFKSKVHAKKVGTYQRCGMTATDMKYLNPITINDKKNQCPKKLRYQFTDECKLKIDYKCCVNLKENPLKEYGKKNSRPYSIVGIKHGEGGARKHAKCLNFEGSRLKNFQPLIPLSDQWEDWFIEKYDVVICDIYREPYNFYRTGCKGCPFALKLQDELDALEKYFPDERRQCEIIWKPVYDEYRRLKYRLH